MAEAALVGSGIHDEFDGTYGEPRVTTELARRGRTVNHKRVERLMRVHGIVGRAQARQGADHDPGRCSISGPGGCWAINTYNHPRLHLSLGYVPPVERETSTVNPRPTRPRDST